MLLFENYSAQTYKKLNKNSQSMTSIFISIKNLKNISIKLKIKPKLSKIKSQKDKYCFYLHPYILINHIEI
ncbi:hypothetical protein GCM10007354_04600 [Acinetobacter courvalinii]|uniref:Uncharacterized protein n=1 Tax=Acinetobacter courvalinii TaxID=280147 RepID=A0ABD0A3M8_9GAMM|nr:hypothetical protein GCM10007354_04600 [Acinetobacter courvalinii]